MNPAFKSKQTSPTCALFCLQSCQPDNPLQTHLDTSTNKPEKLSLKKVMEEEIVGKGHPIRRSISQKNLLNRECGTNRSNGSYQEIGLFRKKAQLES